MPAQSVFCHDRAALIARGLTPTGDVSADTPGYGLLRKIAIRLNVQLGGVTAFRTAPNRWEVFKRPDAVAGFTDEAVLP